MMEFLATCAFGIEAILKREIQQLKFTVTRSSNGKVFFSGDIKTMMMANIHLRTAERIFMVLGEKKVLSYDQLFDFIKTLKLKPIVSEYGQYNIQAKSVKSKLFSPRDIQSIVNKALIENLKAAYKVSVFEESKEKYAFLLDLQKDQALFLLDTSGAALHKRGYRINQGEAPLKETLASALVQLSFFDASRTLYDPFCGAGTIVIEAAMIAKNIAPGLNRSFAFLHFPWIDKTVYQSVKKAAYKNIIMESSARLYASDIDPKLMRYAEENATEAGVEDIIDFQVADFKIREYGKDYGIIITNPPYGERLETTKDAEVLYKDFGLLMKKHPSYSYYVISSYPGVEGIFKQKADRTRVLFNGKIKTRYYQYYGPKPE